MADPIKVDCHIHLYRTPQEGMDAKEGYTIWEYGRQDRVALSKQSGTVEEVEEAMTRAGISKAIIVNLYPTQDARARYEKLGLPKSEIEPRIREEFKDYNRWACQVARTHPRIATYIGLDVGLFSQAENLAHLQELLDAGATGLKLHGPAQGFSMADERLWPIYAACQERGLPIIAHSGPDKAGKGFSEPGMFAAALKAFPKLTLALAHMGGATWRQARELAAACPNACFDVCEVIEWNRSENGPSDADLAQLIKDIGPSRVMMGSDYPWYDLDHTVERVMALPVLSREEKEGILGANALRILKL